MDKVFGKHSARAVVLRRPDSVRRMLLAGKEEYHRDLIHLARGAGITPELVPWPEFLREGDFSEDDKHQGVVLFTKPRLVFDEGDLDRLADAHAVVVLDQLSDPQNFGTILRASAFFGADAVLFLKNRAVDVSPVVARVAVGGAEFVDLFRVTNLARSMRILKDFGFWVYGLDERGDRTLAETTFDEKTVLVVGAEGEGLRRRTKEMCDVLVRIPGGRTGVESLNAGVAAAVGIYEVFRGRSSPHPPARRPR